MTRSERQEECVKKWIASKCRGTVIAPTGTGKTRIAIIAIQKFLTKNPGRKIIVIVPTEVLQTQWNNILYNYGLFLNCSVKIINSAIKEKWTCDFLIMDEIHRFSSTTFRSVVEEGDYKIVLGLSATYERLDGLHRSVMDFYCPPCEEITLTEALESGWISPVKQYLVLLEVDDIATYEGYNQKFLECFSSFDYDFDLAMRVATDFKFRAQHVKSVAASNPLWKKEDVSKFIHAAAFGFIKSLKARKEFVYNHPKKIEIANFILEHRQDKKAITFWKTIKMCEQIQYGNVLHSAQTKKKRRITMSEFNELDKGVINSSKALNEGIDCPGLNLGIIGGLDSSKTTRIQQIGRIIRFEEGKEAELFVLVIKNTVENKWFNNGNQNEYTTFTEEELKNFILGKSYETTKNKETKLDLIFRF